MDTQRRTTRTPSNEWGPIPPHGGRDRSPRRLLVWLERGLLLVGFLLVGYYAYATAEAHLYQAFEDRELDAILNSVSARADAPSAGTGLPPGGGSDIERGAGGRRESGGGSFKEDGGSYGAKGGRSPEPTSAGTAGVRAEAATVSRRRALPAGSIVGRIEIPRLEVSVVVRVGADAGTLKLAVGHIPGTALPGEPGNVGLAGHRDTFFRRLRDIRTDDEIRLVTPTGTYRYRVERTRVVEPRDVWVLDPTPEPALTLVTCYPFTFIGSAPQRFIVRAQQLDAG